MTGSARPLSRRLVFEPSTIVNLDPMRKHWMMRRILVRDGFDALALVVGLPAGRLVVCADWLAGQAGQLPGLKC